MMDAHTDRVLLGCSKVWSMMNRPMMSGMVTGLATVVIALIGSAAVGSASATVSSYAYEGSVGASYANPHAVTAAHVAVPTTVIAEEMKLVTL